ncbi:MAG: 50S ribosomal protein L32e [Thaumarchaeota archaeon]|nr:MAG: 50S ribosomal protein L32e [Nitrososphaerota archaeon]RLG04787.1 MAG: 50S ribosomal protein L32e [Nitrososphaerota archaeon]HDD43190.1 50S ribosomal protein L32e [Nitrososphaeria archaeon]
MSPIKIPKRVRELKLKRPRFVRQESWRYVRLKPNWRRPRGKDSKMRLQIKGWPPLVKVGYRTPRAYRNLHPSGFKEVLVYRPEDLQGLDPEIHAVRIAGSVGMRKRLLIVEEAEKLGIKILNPPTVPEAEEVEVVKPELEEAQETEEVKESGA